MQKSEQLQKADQIVQGESLLHISNDEEKAMVYNQATAQKILQVFAGREDLFSKETLGAGGKRQTELQAVPLSEQQIMNHLKGDITIGTYIQRPNSTVKYMVIDVDISKKIMLQSTKRQHHIPDLSGKGMALCRGAEKNLKDSWDLQLYRIFRLSRLSCLDFFHGMDTCQICKYAYRYH